MAFTEIGNSIVLLVSGYVEYVGNGATISIQIWIYFIRLQCSTITVVEHMVKSPISHQYLESLISTNSSITLEYAPCVYVLIYRQLKIRKPAHQIRPF